MRSKTKSRSGPIVEPLEQRILFSADPFGLGIDTSAPAELTADILPENIQRKPTAAEVFIVDENIPNFQQFIDSLNSRSNNAQLIQIYTINDSQTVSHVSDILTQHNNLNTVHFISHGDDANLRLGSSILNNSTISSFESELRIWGESISESGDLLFYGCNLAETTDGQTLVQEIASLTGAEVGASENLTGHSSLGGDWTLEYTTGDIDSENLLLSDDTEAWEAVLATITVTTEVDEVDAADLSSIANLQADPGGSGISLREAIIAANSSAELDTIKLPAGNYDLTLDAATAGTTEDQYHGDLDVWNNILLQGDGIGDTTIDAKNLDRVFSFTGGISNTIENVKIQNGETSESGGGILVKDTTLTLNYVDLHNNESLDNTGGGIYVDGSSVTVHINDSILRKNSAGVDVTEEQPGGAIHNWAGTVNIKRTEITENKGSYGGAIFNHGLLNLKDSWLQLNTAYHRGGAIHSEGTTIIDRTLFEQNNANGGGAISSTGYTLIENSTFAVNNAANNGGAILQTTDSGGTSGTTEIYHSTIANNTASDFGAIGRLAGTVNIQSNIFDNNGGLDIEPGVTSLGFNIADSVQPIFLETDNENTDPHIENALSDEGGFSKVYALKSISPAINGGATIDQAQHDATGAARNEIADIGAFEYRQTDAVGEIFWTEPSNNAIYRSNTDGTLVQEIISNRPDNIRDIEVDTVNGHIYWVESNTTTNRGNLYSAKLDGSDIQILTSGLFDPAGLALDIENERIFVTNNSTAANGAATNSIEFITYESTPALPPNPAIITGTISDSPPQQMQTPIEVEYNPLTGTVFWADQGPGNGGIQSITSSNIVTTVLELPDSMNDRPQGLSIDPDSSTIYWSNFSDVIYEGDINNLNVDGSNADTIDVPNAPLIVGLQYHKESDTIFAADISGNILAVQADNSGTTELHTGRSQPTHLTVASLSEVNEGPSVEINTGITTDENTAVTITDTYLNSIDPNTASEFIVYTVTDTFPSEGQLWLNGIDITSAPAAAPTFTQSDINAGLLEYRQQGSEVTADIFQFTLTDGVSTSAVNTFDIYITLTNDAPVVASLESATLNYTENTSVSLTSSLTLTDADDTHLESAVIKITSGYNSNQDLLELTTNPAAINQSWNQGAGELTLSGTFTLAQYQDAIKNVSYTNNSEDPDSSPRSFSIVVNDGELNSTTQSRPISITSVNDAPAITSVETSALNYAEGAGKVQISNSLLLNDLDSTTISSATVQFTGGYNSTEDSLTAVNIGTITSSWDEATRTLTLSSSSSPASIYDYQAALRSVTYENTSLNADTTTRTVTFSANDGTLDSIASNREIAISAINNDPEITLSDSINYIENDPLKQIAPNAIISDPDAPDLDGAILTIALTTGATTADILGATTTGDGTGQVNVSGTSFLYEGVEHGTFTDGGDGQAPLIITFNSLATNQSVQAILQSISYRNLSESPEPSVGFEISLTDGNGNPGSATAVGSINITATNDAPVIHNLDGIAIIAMNDGSTYPLDTNALAATSDADLPSNFDGGNLTVTKSGFTADDSLEIATTGTVSLSGGYANGSALGISGTAIGTLKDISASSFTVDFNSFATPTRIDELVQSLQFYSTATELGIRSIELSLTDGDGTANGGSDTSTASVNIYLSESTQEFVFLPEDSVHAFQTSEFALTGTTESELETITITSLPANGTLKLNGNSVAVNEQISKHQLGNGSLTFTPDPNANGSPYTSFDFYFNSGNKTVQVLAGHNSIATFDSFHFKAAEILGNASNFGPGGTVSTDVLIKNSNSIIDANYLSQGSVMFSGYFPDGTLDPSELAAIDTWVNNGGILISSGDRSNHDDLNSYYGLNVTDGGSDLWTVDDTNNPIVNGPFGVVSDFSSEGRYVGYFEDSAVLSTDIVLARDSSNSKPTMILRQVGDGQIVFTSDEGIFRGDMTGGGSIVTSNDIITANTYAWAIESAVPEDIHTISVHVTPVNDASIVILPDTPLYVENAAAELIMPSATVTDIDSTDFETGTIDVTLTTNASSADSLKISNTSTISINSGTNVILYSGSPVGTFSGGELNSPLTIQLNNNADSVSAQEILRSISFESTDNDPGTSRTFKLDFSDGDGGATTDVRNLVIEPVNDDPINSGTIPATSTVTEDNTSDINLSLINLTDADSLTTDTLKLILGAGTNGILSATTANGITISGNTSNSLEISGTLTDLNLYLNNASNITYSNSVSHTNGISADSISISINDNGNTGTGGGTDILLGTTVIDISPMNDDPSNIGSLPTEIIVTEGTDSDIDLFPVNLFDLDDGGSSIITVTLETIHSDVLTANGAAGISIDGNSTSVKLHGTLNNLNSYLNNASNISYKHPDVDYNGITADTLTLKVNDNGNTGAGGGTDINLGTIPIHIDAINDAPENNGSLPADISGTEDTITTVDLSLIDLSDVDDQGMPITITIDTTTGGNLEAIAATGITINGFSTESLSLVGALADLNNYLNNTANITYSHPTQYINGTSVDTLHLAVNDNGNTGAGGGTNISLGSVNVSIDAVNNNPINTGVLPAAITVIEDTPSFVDLSVIQIEDVDDLNGDVTITLSTASGSLLVANPATGITDVTNGSSLTLTGSITDLNTYLDTPANLTYLHKDQNTNGNNADSISITVNDNGNTGTGGGIDVDLGSVPIDINAINDDPENNGSLPTDISGTEDTIITVDLSPIDLSDVDDQGIPITITIDTITGGNLSAISTSEITINGAGTTSLSLVGALTDINNYLNNTTNITYSHPTPNINGASVDTLNLTVNDNGNTGTGGGTDISLGSVNLTIDAVNDKPINTGVLPATITVIEDTPSPVDLSLIHIEDVDDLTGDVTITLNTASGSLLVANPATGISSATIGSALTLTGSLAALNTYLDTPANLTYQHKDQNTNGNNADSIAITVNDNGNTGAGGGVDVDLGSVPIHIDATNDAPENTGLLPTVVSVTEDTFTTVNLSSIELSDVDDQGMPITFKIDTTTGGNLEANAAPGITINGFGTESLSLSGALTDLNNYLNNTTNTTNITYSHPTPNINGASVDTLNLTVNDNGNTGTGGGTDILLGTTVIDISPMNDDPSNIGSLPTEITVTEGTDSDIDLSSIKLSDQDDGGSSIMTVILETIHSDVLTANGATGISIDGNSTSLRLHGTLGNLNNYLNNASNISYKHPDVDYNGITADTLTLKVNDNGNTGSGGGTDINLGTISIHINATNDAPENTGSLPTVASGTEDTIITVNLSSIVLSDVDDQGMPITFKIDTTNGGNLEANAAPGITINGFGTESLNLSGALTDLNNYLNNTTNITYSHPTPYINGASVDTLNLTVNDNGNTGTGGGTDISLGSVNVSIDAVNNNPVNTGVLPATITVTEDTPSPVDLSLVQIDDVDDLNGDVTITLSTTSESLLVATPAVGITDATNGASLTLTGSITDLNTYLDTPANLTYQHKDENTNGNNADTISITVNDNGNTGAGGGVDVDLGSVPINIIAINDAPEGHDNTITTFEDTPLHFTLSDFGFSDEADSNSHSLKEIVITSPPATGSLLLNGIAITGTTTATENDIALAKLIWEPDTDKHGTPYSEFKFRVVDSGGTGNGGIDTALNENTMAIDVLPVNDPPSGQNTTLWALEDINYVFNTSDFGFTDNKDLDPLNSLHSVVIDSLPAAGSLSLFGSPVNTNDQISASDINADGLTFLSEPSSNGINYAQLAFRVIDDGGNNHGGNNTATSNNTLTLNVLDVNDEPSGINTTITGIEDTSYSIAAEDFGFIDLLDGNALSQVMITTPPLDGTLIYNGSQVAPGGVIPIKDIEDGALTYIPAGSVNGIAVSSIGFRAIDNGGTANGGIDTARAEATISINITAVNDPPVGSNTTLTAIEDTPYKFTNEAFGFSDIDHGDTLSAVIIDSVSGNGTLTANGTLVSAGETIDLNVIDTGELLFNPSPNSYGLNHTRIDFRVVDSGNPSLGLNTATHQATLVFDVIPVNDAPSSILVPNLKIAENTENAFVSDLLVTDNDSDDSHTLTVDDSRFEIINGQLSLKPDLIIDFEAEPEIPLVITAVDENGESYTQLINLLIIDTNDAPEIQLTPEPQTATPPFSFGLPSQTFVDQDDDQLIYSATLDNGDPLPTWLVFDPSTQEFTVSTPPLPVNSVNVLVTAADGSGTSATTSIQVILEPEFATALPSAPALEIVTTEPDPETKETPERKTAVSTPQENLALLNNQQERQPSADDAELPLPLEIPQTEYTELGIELIQTSKTLPVAKAAEAQFIQVNSTPQQQTKEQLITEVALRKLSNQMDDSKQQQQDLATNQTKVLGTSVTMASGLSVGYIFWMLRSGTLLASILTSLPAWKYIDPLPVLDSITGSDDDTDQETLESMVEEIPEVEKTDRDNNDRDKAA